MESVDGIAGAAASWGAVVLAGYLSFGLAAAIAEQRTALTRFADRLLRLYPRLVRLALRATAVAVVGIGAVAPTSAASAAAPGRSGPPRPPVLAPARPSPEPLDWPTTSLSRRVVERVPAHVTVRPGECLWSIAARAIGPDATPAEIAAAWPRWWSANRDGVGTDPDLLQPGLQLRVPTSERSSS